MVNVKFNLERSHNVTRNSVDILYNTINYNKCKAVNEYIPENSTTFNMNNDSNKFIGMESTSDAGWQIISGSSPNMSCLESTVGAERSTNMAELQKIMDSTVSTGGSNSVTSILEQVHQLNDVQKLQLYLKLPTTATGINCQQPSSNISSGNMLAAQSPVVAQQGHHYQPSESAKNRSEDQFTITWIRTHLELDPKVSLLKKDVYYEYEHYCNERKFKSQGRADFGKLMKQVFPNLKPRRLGQRGASQYCYSGLRKTYCLSQPEGTELYVEKTKANPQFWGNNISGFGDKSLNQRGNISNCALNVVLEWAGKALSLNATPTNLENSSKENCNLVSVKSEVERRSSTDYQESFGSEFTSLLDLAISLVREKRIDSKTHHATVIEKFANQEKDEQDSSRFQLQKKLQEKEQKRKLQEDVSTVVHQTTDLSSRVSCVNINPGNLVEKTKVRRRSCSSSGASSRNPSGDSNTSGVSSLSSASSVHNETIASAQFSADNSKMKSAFNSDLYSLMDVKPNIACISGQSFDTKPTNNSIAGSVITTISSNCIAKNNGTVVQLQRPQGNPLIQHKQEQSGNCFQLKPQQTGNYVQLKQQQYSNNIQLKQPQSANSVELKQSQSGNCVQRTLPKPPQTTILTQPRPMHTISLLQPKQSQMNILQKNNAQTDNFGQLKLSQSSLVQSKLPQTTTNSSNSQIPCAMIKPPPMTKFVASTSEPYGNNINAFPTSAKNSLHTLNITASSSCNPINKQIIEKVGCNLSNNRGFQSTSRQIDNAVAPNITVTDGMFFVPSSEMSTKSTQLRGNRPNVEQLEEEEQEGKLSELRQMLQPVINSGPTQQKQSMVSLTSTQNNQVTNRNIGVALSNINHPSCIDFTPIQGGATPHGPAYRNLMVSNCNTADSSANASPFTSPQMTPQLPRSRHNSGQSTYLTPRSTPFNPEESSVSNSTPFVSPVTTPQCSRSRHNSSQGARLHHPMSRAPGPLSANARSRHSSGAAPRHPYPYPKDTLQQRQQQRRIRNASGGGILAAHSAPHSPLIDNAEFGGGSILQQHLTNNMSDMRRRHLSAGHTLQPQHQMQQLYMQQVSNAPMIVSNNSTIENQFPRTSCTITQNPAANLQLFSVSENTTEGNGDAAAGRPQSVPLPNMLRAGNFSQSVPSTPLLQPNQQPTLHQQMSHDPNRNHLNESILITGDKSIQQNPQYFNFEPGMQQFADPTSLSDLQLDNFNFSTLDPMTESSSPNISPFSAETAINDEPTYNKMDNFTASITSGINEQQQFESFHSSDSMLESQSAIVRLNTDTAYAAVPSNQSNASSTDNLMESSSGGQEFNYFASPENEVQPFLDATSSSNIFPRGQSQDVNASMFSPSDLSQQAGSFPNEITLNELNASALSDSNHLTGTDLTVDDNLDEVFNTPSFML